MRHRITYFGRPGSSFSPEQVIVTADSLTVHNLDAAKEHRITLGLTELPKELRWLVQQSKELHIRWSSSTSFPRFGPHVSELSPGLHVLHTPEKSAKAGVEASHSVSAVLIQLFGPGMKASPKGYSATFTKPPRSNFRQLYSYLETLVPLRDYIRNNICGNADTGYCTELADTLLQVQSLDMSYDYIKQAATVTAYWDKPPNGPTWDEVMSKNNLHSDTTEIGIFGQEDTKSHEELKLGGSLAVIGEDTKPKATQFSFPSRHHTVKKSSFTSSFDRPAGLHPTLRLFVSIDSTSAPTRFNPTCRPHTYLTLPSPLFIDRYAFADKLFLDSHHLRALHSISGATDLEAPDWAVAEWGSASLFEIQVPDNYKAGAFDVTIPLHTRYLSPVSGGLTNVTMPYPIVFYACKAMEEDLPPLHTNPFDRTDLGYDGLFGERTIFYHVHPKAAGGKLALDLAIPVLDLDRAAYIEPVTVLVIVMGCLWIAWKLFWPMRVAASAKAGILAGKDVSASEQKKKI